MISYCGRMATIEDLRTAYAKIANRSTSTMDRGIRRAARDMGCCYSHLSRVLRGERSSVSLHRRYAEWKRTHVGV